MLERYSDEILEIINNEKDYYTYINISKNGLELKCEIKRNNILKTLNGYIHIPKECYYFDNKHELNINFTDFQDDFIIVGFDTINSLILNKNYKNVDDVKQIIFNICETISSDKKYVRFQKINKILNN